MNMQKLGRQGLVVTSSITIPSVLHAVITGLGTFTAVCHATPAKCAARLQRATSRQLEADLHTHGCMPQLHDVNNSDVHKQMDLSCLIHACSPVHGTAQ